MRNLILGTIAGLFVGTMGALAYSHYLGDGSLVSDLQAKLDEANADLANLKAAHVAKARLASSSTEQVSALAEENADLRKELDDAKAGTKTAVAPAPEVNISTLAGLMMGMMRGGGGPFQAQQRLFTMQARLHLTPDQAAKIKVAMDADNQARREMMRQRFGRGGGGPGGGGPGGGGPGGGSGTGGAANASAAPATPPAVDNLDKTLKSVLTYQQQADYQKLQVDEKAARAETSATTQVNNVMPLLQLTDSQKEAAMQQLYQVQVNAPDPNSLVADPNPMAQITSQAAATQAVLAKVLTPDQMTLYQQQAKAQSEAMAQFGQGRQRGGGAGGNAGAGATPTAPATAAPAASTAPSAATTNAPAASTTAATTNADGTPATPAASTNAAPVTQ